MKRLYIKIGYSFLYLLIIYHSTPSNLSFPIASMYLDYIVKIEYQVSKLIQQDPPPFFELASIISFKVKLLFILAVITI